MDFVPDFGRWSVYHNVKLLRLVIILKLLVLRGLRRIRVRNMAVRLV